MADLSVDGLIEGAHQYTGPRQIPVRLGEPLRPLCPERRFFWQQQHSMVGVRYEKPDGWSVGFNAVCQRCGYVEFWAD